MEHRETPDGQWRTADLVVANDYEPLRGADAARDRPGSSSTGSAPPRKPPPELGR
ncbi:MULTISPECIES: hypothetical protein [unclassified Streptomyces]|uniref:hypothetical protein n=1 Tax=unclassified Streptomyces TaxID=2593676 RepID=UPI00131ED8F9|nr:MULTISPECIES: hypothetical protein [unclassified Streptomyces]KAF0794524.1 hypothetical protein P405_06980 [Streptomyces sp. FR-008]MYQ74790.1 hypothetical protein [Streptomyces sp. SID4934]